MGFPVEMNYQDVCAGSNYTATCLEQSQNLYEVHVCTTGLPSGGTLDISPTLSYHETGNEMSPPSTRGENVSRTTPRVDGLSEALGLCVAGVIDAVEHARLVQKIRDLHLNYPLKTLKALLTLDSKLRKVVREDSKNKLRVDSTIQSSLARWHMQATQQQRDDSTGNGAASSSWQGTHSNQSQSTNWDSSSGAWSEVRRKKKKDKQVAFDKEEEVIALCPSIWDIPVREEKDFRQDGVEAVYQISTREKLSEMALASIHAEVAVVAVAPFKINVGFSPPQQMTIPFTVDQSGLRTRAHISVWVYQLSAREALPATPIDPIDVSIEGTDAKSCIISVDVDVVECSGELIDEVLKKTVKARQLIASRLPKPLVVDLLDVFRVTRSAGRWLSALLRVRESSVPEFLALSGLHNLWINTPRNWMEQTRVIWMRDNADPSCSMSLDEVREAITKLEAPLGIVAKQQHDGTGWSFAVRVRTENYKKSQASLSMDLRDTYFLQGLPTGVSEEAVAQILTKMKWIGTVVPDSRRVYRGRASVTVKSKHQPPITTFVVRVDSEQVQLKVVSKKAHARARSLPPRLNKQEDRTQVEATSWHSAFQG
eukprot:6490240-Amphidinium_carterae.1